MLTDVDRGHGSRLIQKAFLALEQAGGLVLFKLCQDIAAQGLFLIAFVCQMKQTHHQVTGTIGIMVLFKPSPDLLIIPFGYQLVTPTVVAQGSRFFDQRLDQMPLIDAM